MMIKVCGLRDKENVQAVCQCDIQMIGLNFYPLSSRYVPTVDKHMLHAIPDYIKKVGVFVTADLDTLKGKIKEFQLDYVQLHGDEDFTYCQEVSKQCRIIKVFRIDNTFDWESTKKFSSISEYFLFDTKTASYGGSGKQFQWDVLDQYEEATPFLLSGGIGPEDAISLRQLFHPQLVGIDINSKFEIAPAVKSRELIETFITVLNQQ